MLVENTNNSPRFNGMTKILKKRIYIETMEEIMQKIKDYEGELYFDIEDVFDIKKKIINNVKGGKLVGYSNFNIYIEADEDMQRVAYNCGLGERNTMGCGNLKFIKSE